MPQMFQSESLKQGNPPKKSPKRFRAFFGAKKLVHKSMVGPQVGRLGNHMAITNFRTWRPDLWILTLCGIVMHSENYLEVIIPKQIPAGFASLPLHPWELQHLPKQTPPKPHPSVSRKKPTKQQKKHVTTDYPAAAGSPMCPHFLVPGFWSWKVNCDISMLSSNILKTI